MRRQRNGTTQVWHNPELATQRGLPRSSAAGQVTESASDKRQASQHRAALEALFSPPAEKETRGESSGRVAQTPKPGGRIVLAPPPQADPQAAVNSRRDADTDVPICLDAHLGEARQSMDVIVPVEDEDHDSAIGGAAVLDVDDDLARLDACASQTKVRVGKAEPEREARLVCVAIEESLPVPLIVSNLRCVRVELRKVSFVGGHGEWKSSCRIHRAGEDVGNRVSAFHAQQRSNFARTVSRAHVRCGE